MKERPEDYKPGENDNVEELFRYRGEWVVETPPGKGVVEGDKGLSMKTPSAHHAISVSFPKSFDPANKGIVVQFDVKFKEELKCSGSYIKLLTESEDGIKYQEFSDKTPYTIMFGPDMCGSTNKVHFIFRHLNPKTGQYEEKHLKSAPSIKNNLKSNLYTLSVKPDNTFEIFINKESEKKGSLLEDFDPPVNPPKEIDDPNDKKPQDWVDEEKIPDPDATKPDDWDEDAPRMIVDEDAEKPEDWLEDEPEMVPDPEATKPEDWDEEEDGEWKAAEVPNPKCEKVSGCGKWEKPMKPNPEYKGKWEPPMIDNPKYKGPWSPKKIPNPDYFEDLHPAKLNKIMGIGIENWVMQAGITFDNFFVGDSLQDAFKFADETWKVKRGLEDKEIKEEKPEVKEDDYEGFDDDEEDEQKVSEDADWQTKVKTAANKWLKKGRKLYKKSVLPVIKPYVELTQEFVDEFRRKPVDAVRGYPAVAFTLMGVFLLPIILAGMSGEGGKEEKKEKKEEKTE